MQGGGMSSVQPQYFRLYYDIVSDYKFTQKKKMGIS